jgi:uncharacterized protein YndB with AHSA1/START domain
MKPVDTTDRSQSETLSFELELQHSPHKVWRALTEPELLKQWLLPVTGLKLEPGAAFTLNTQPVGGWDGTVKCRVLEVEEHKKLRYGWVVGDMELDTVLTFTLSPSSSGTRLSIVQSGFKPHQKQAFGGARYGWNLMSGKLIDLLAKGD